MTTAPRTIVTRLVRAWAEPADAASRGVLAPVVAVQEVLSTRGYDDRLHRARIASKVDPFALGLGLDRLARDLLLGSKAGRPRLLADLLVSFLPARAKRPREVAALARAAERKDRGALPSLAAALGTAEFAASLEKAAFADALATGSGAARLEVATRIGGLAHREMTMWFHPLLSRPELTVALAAAARDAHEGSALEEALVHALVGLHRYVIDARTRPLLVASLASPSPATRQAAARGLLVGSRATAWPKETWGPVIALLDDESAEVRAGVSFALLANRDRLTTADRNAVAARLEAHLADRSLAVRLGAVSGLVGLRGNAFLADAKALERGEKNAKMRLVLKRAIAELG